MNDIVVPNWNDKGTETTIIFPRTTSYGWWIEETRLTFNSSLITAFTALKADGWERSGCNGNEFSSLVWDNSIIWIKRVVVKWRELKSPSFPDIIGAILEDEDSYIWTVIVHADEY